MKGETGIEYQEGFIDKKQLMGWGCLKRPLSHSERSEESAFYKQIRRFFSRFAPSE
jgi:hypothetical protein